MADARDPEYWTCDDAPERLDCGDEDEAILDWLQGWVPGPYPAQIEVYGYARVQGDEEDYDDEEGDPCELVATKTINTLEWMETHRDEWLEEGETVHIVDGMVRIAPERES